MNQHTLHQDRMLARHAIKIILHLNPQANNQLLKTAVAIIVSSVIQMKNSTMSVSEIIMENTGDTNLKCNNSMVVAIITL